MPSNVDHESGDFIRPRSHSAQPGIRSHTHAAKVGGRDDPPPNVPHFLRPKDIVEEKNVSAKQLARVQYNDPKGPRDRHYDDVEVDVSGRHRPGVGQDRTVEPPRGVVIVEAAGRQEMPRSQRRYREVREPTRGASSGSPVMIVADPDRDRGPERQRETMLRIDPRSGQDVTVHMSLPVQDDLEDVLEECSRLRRLGHFTAAIALFRDRLSHFLDNRYVLVQYAQCLYDAGQFSQLEELAKDKDLPRFKIPDSLQLNWEMLLLAAVIRPREDFDLPAMHLAVEVLIANAWPDLDSTQCQVLALSPQIGLPMEKVLPRRGIISLFRHLINRGMVWEFRDLLQAHLNHSYPLEVLTSITTPLVGTDPTHSAPPTPADHLQLLRKLCTERAEDEPTLFALLDSLTTLALHARQAFGLEGMTKACMAAADECGFALLAMDDENLMTRPCLRWIVAKRMINDNNELLFYKQLTLIPDERGPSWELAPLGFSRSVFPSDRLPRFDFREGSIAQWKPRPVLPGELNDFASTTEMVLRAAEELGDQELQTGCLRELMYRGIRPAGEVISKLRKIWTEAGNNYRLPHLNFFRAMVAHTPPERKALQRDILLEIETGHKVDTIDRFYLLAALDPDPAQQKVYREMAEALDPGVSSDDSSQGTVEPHDRPSLPTKMRERTIHISKPYPLSRKPQPVKPQPAHDRPLPARPAPQLPAPAPGLPRPTPVQQAHPATETETDSNQRIAKIKDEMGDVEQAILSAEKSKDGRELRSLYNKLHDLTEERHRLEMERLESNCASDIDDANIAHAPMAVGDSARVSGSSSPSRRPPRRRTTVEDYLGTSDASDNTERVEEEKIEMDELRARHGAIRAPLLLEYGGHGDGELPADVDANGKASEC